MTDARASVDSAGSGEAAEAADHMPGEYQTCALLRYIGRRPPGGLMYCFSRAGVLTLLAVGIVCAQTSGSDVSLVKGIGNFSHIVSNLDKSIEFYRDVLGLELTAPPAPFSPNPAIMKL